jgi:hypothetical protein
MTTRHDSDQAAPCDALPSRQRHLRLAPQAEVTHTEAGRFAVPLELRGTAERLPLILTADDAESLRDQLSVLLPVGRDGSAQ